MNVQFSVTVVAVQTDVYTFPAAERVSPWPFHQADRGLAVVAGSLEVIPTPGNDGENVSNFRGLHEFTMDNHHV